MSAVITVVNEIVGDRAVTENTNGHRTKNDGIGAPGMTIDENTKKMISIDEENTMEKRGGIAEIEM